MALPNVVSGNVDFNGSVLAKATGDLITKDTVDKVMIIAAANISVATSIVREDSSSTLKICQVNMKGDKVKELAGGVILRLRRWVLSSLSRLM